MSCSCGDSFCDGYSCNDDNNSGGGGGIVIIFLLYPYLPFMVVGYELMEKFSDGVNIFKWAGCAIGLAIGLFFYFKLFKRFVNEVLNIYNFFLYWLIVYSLASLMFYVLNFIYSENQIVIKVTEFWKWFFNWAQSVS